MFCQKAWRKYVVQVGHVIISVLWWSEALTNGNLIFTHCFCNSRISCMEILMSVCFHFSLIGCLFLHDLVRWSSAVYEESHLSRIKAVQDNYQREFTWQLSVSVTGFIWTKAMGLPDWSIQTRVLQVIWHDSRAFTEYISASRAVCIENSVSLTHDFLLGKYCVQMITVQIRSLLIRIKLT